MDFTYIFAFLFGVIVALPASIIAALLKRRIPKIAARIFVLAVACLALALSIDWTHLGSSPMSGWALLIFVIFDFAMIIGATALGCLVGALPVMAVLALVREWTRE